MIILSIVYHEPSWQETKKCIEATGLPVHYVERNPKGVGSLAEAINRGVREISRAYPKGQYIFIVTNNTFDPELPLELKFSMPDYMVAIQPAFDSDHIHERPNGSGLVKEAPFIEFTCLVARPDILLKYPLDERLPYWGHDIDVCYRLRKDGYEIGVHHGFTIGHTYIRHNLKNGNRFTKRRYELRKKTDASTRRALERKYGHEWRDIIFPKTPEQIGAFYEQVKQKILA